jgi:hypothetical protein
MGPAVAEGVLGEGGLLEIGSAECSSNAALTARWARWSGLDVARNSDSGRFTSTKLNKRIITCRGPTTADN